MLNCLIWPAFSTSLSKSEPVINQVKPQFYINFHLTLRKLNGNVMSFIYLQCKRSSEGELKYFCHSWKIRFIMQGLCACGQPSNLCLSFLIRKMDVMFLQLTRDGKVWLAYMTALYKCSYYHCLFLLTTISRIWRRNIQQNSAATRVSPLHLLTITSFVFRLCHKVCMFEIKLYLYCNAVEVKGFDVGVAIQVKHLFLKEKCP